MKEDIIFCSIASGSPKEWVVHLTPLTASDIEVDSFYMLERFTVYAKYMLHERMVHKCVMIRGDRVLVSKKSPLHNRIHVEYMPDNKEIFFKLSTLDDYILSLTEL